MSTPPPRPARPAPADPAAITAEIDARLASLDASAAGADLAARAEALEELHHTLAAALATIDQV